MGIVNRGGYWHYSFKLPGQIQQRGTTGYKDKKLAAAFYHKKRTEAKEMRDFKKPSKMTVRELLEWTNKTHWGYGDTWEWQVRAVLNRFGKQQAAQILYTDIVKFQADRLEAVAPDTVNKEITLLAAAYNYAMKASLLYANPAKHIKKIDCSDKRREKFLNPQEKMTLINAAEGLLQDLIVFALQTGMRKGEILALKWADVDFERQQMRVVSRKGNKIIVRHVPIFDRAGEVLRAQPRVSEYVFTNDDPAKRGQPLGDQCCAHSTYQRLIKKLNIQGGDFTFHDLRHTFASDYLMVGNSLAALATVLGHRRFDTTRRYAHLSKEHMQAGIDRMPKLVYDRNTGAKPENIYHNFSTVGLGEEAEMMKSTGNHTSAVSSAG